MSNSRLRLPGHWTETRIARVIAPMQEFIQSSTASGIVLLFVTLFALVVANSPFSADYGAILDTYIGIQVGPYELRLTLLHWINDGLMAIFFFQVGLEIKREIWAGELSNFRAAILPILAALGGAIVPALIYSIINLGGEGSPGWGIPMATDIAFSLGVLALAGSRVPYTLKILLTAIAIIDDLIAVLVIALFYSGSIKFGALAVGFAFLAALLIMNALGVRTIPLYVLAGVLVWVAFLESGVHATVAGVLVAFTIPARNRIDQPTFLRRARTLLDRFEESSKREPYSILQDQEQQTAVISLEEECEAVQAPLQKMEHALHNWVSFGIIPLFALANAGVAFTADALSGGTLTVALGILVGLVIGKPVGLVGAIWLGTRLGLVSLPPGISWLQILALGCLGGVGFTMSIFIATLAFDGSALLETAKLGILTASLIAGILGFVLVRYSATRDSKSVASG